MEHPDLNVDTGSFLNKLTLLIEFSSFSPLFHLLTDTSNFNNESVIVEFISNIESSLNIAHLNGSARYTGIALCVVLFNINLLIMLIIRIKQCLLIQFLCLDCIPLILNLTCELPAYVLFLLRGDLFT